MFWHHAIEAVGAGLATVLGNLQVIIVGFFAWLRPRGAAVARDPDRAADRARRASSSSRASSARARTARTRRSGSSSGSRPRSATPATCSSSGWAAATSAGRRARSRSRRSSTFLWRLVVGDRRRRPRPDAAAREPVLAGAARRHGQSLGYLLHLDLAAAPAGGHHLVILLAQPVIVGRARHGPARRDAVGRPAPGRRRSSSAASPSRPSRSARIRDGLRRDPAGDLG